MIPLSNGRSPRIDQFYATLRTYKSHKFDQDFNNRNEQEKSIQHILSLGKQILEPLPLKKRFHLNKQSVNVLHRSTQSLLKPNNLYDKYKVQTNKKVDNLVNNVKVKLIKEQINKTAEKVKVSKKYQQVPSKIYVKNTLKGLNYTKKIDIQAQKLKKQKLEAQKIQEQIKNKQNYFQKNGLTTRTYKQSGLLKHAEQLKARKQKHVQKIRNQELEKQMSHLTFHPQMISRKFNTTQPDFQKRNQLASTQRLSKQKILLKQELQAYTFLPRTNSYKYTDSKLSKIWKTEQRKINKMDSIIEYINQEKTLNSNKSIKTANQTMQINLKSLNQLSFIFQ